ncbi:hypothetical protein QUA71_21915 [Microcoleus sp. MON1_C5]|jgi:hypothetical protein
MYHSNLLKLNKELTAHAYSRCQQRGISELVIDLVIQFGTEKNAGQGTRSVWADKQARKEIKAYVGNATFAVLEPQLKKVYLIVNEEIIVTSAYAHH